MKISQETIALLKNFASINGNLVVKQGNVLSTVSPGKNILSLATVAETFPQEFAIYDLNQLLGLFTFGSDQEVEIEDRGITVVTPTGGKLAFFYSDPSVVTASPYKALDIDSVFTFQLSADEIGNILRSASIFSAPTVSIISNGTDVTLKVGDPANPTANFYETTLTTDSAPTFDARLKVENLKVIMGDYTVAVGKKKALHFKNNSRDLEYWLAMEPSSVV